MSVWSSPIKEEKFKIVPLGDTLYKSLKFDGESLSVFSDRSFQKVAGKSHVAIHKKFKEKVFKCTRCDIPVAWDTLFYKVRRLDKIKAFVIKKYPDRFDRFAFPEIEIVEIKKGRYITVENKMNLMEGTSKVSMDLEQFEVISDLVEQGLLEDPKADNLPMTKDGKVAFVDTEPLSRIEKKKFSAYPSAFFPLLPLFKSINKLRNLCILEVSMPSIFHNSLSDISPGIKKIKRGKREVVLEIALQIIGFISLLFSLSFALGRILMHSPFSSCIPFLNAFQLVYFIIYLEKTFQLFSSLFQVACRQKIEKKLLSF